MNRYFQIGADSNASRTDFQPLWAGQVAPLARDLPAAKLIEANVIGFRRQLLGVETKYLRAVFEIGQTNLHSAIETTPDCTALRRDCLDDWSLQR